MKIRNLSINILYLLAIKWKSEKCNRPFQTQWIYDRFSDIPIENIRRTMESMSEQGLVSISYDGRDIAVTGKGLSNIHANLPAPSYDRWKGL